MSIAQSRDDVYAIVSDININYPNIISISSKLGFHYESYSERPLLIHHLGFASNVATKLAINRSEGRMISVSINSVIVSAMNLGFEEDS